MCKEPHVCEGAEMLRDYIYGTEHSAPHCMCSLSESVLLCFFLLLLLLIAFAMRYSGKV